MVPVETTDKPGRTLISKLRLPFGTAAGVTGPITWQNAGNMEARVFASPEKLFRESNFDLKPAEGFRRIFLEVLGCPQSITITKERLKHKATGPLKEKGQSIILKELIHRWTMDNNGIKNSGTHLLLPSILGKGRTCHQKTNQGAIEDCNSWAVVQKHFDQSLKN